MAINAELPFCQTLDGYFNATIQVVDSAVAAPGLAYQAYASTILAIKSLVGSVAITELELLEDQIGQYLNLKDIEASAEYDIVMNFCDILSACDAFLDLLFSTNDVPLWLPISQDSYEELKALYESGDPRWLEYFKSYVCDVSLTELAGKLSDYLKNQIIIGINAIIDYLNGPIQEKVDEVIAWYRKKLIEYGIFDTLKTLDAFRKCLFETCDFGQSVINKSKGIEQKTGINYDPSIPSWAFDDAIDKYNMELQREILTAQRRAEGALARILGV